MFIKLFGAFFLYFVQKNAAHNRTLMYGSPMGSGKLNELLSSFVSNINLFFFFKLRADETFNLEVANRIVVSTAILNNQFTSLVRFLKVTNRSMVIEIERTPLSYIAEIYEEYNLNSRKV